jgi:hypothetical protein
MIARFEQQLGVQVQRLFIQRMRTKWGSSSSARRSIRLNLDLARFEPGASGTSSCMRWRTSSFRTTMRISLHFWTAICRVGEHFVRSSTMGHWQNCKA